MPHALNAFPQILPPSEHIAFTNELMAYTSGREKLFAAHLVVTLCRFGRWLSRSLCPGIRLLTCWTDPVRPGVMSVELKAMITLRPNPLLPFIPVGAAAMLVLGRSRPRRSA